MSKKYITWLLLAAFMPLSSLNASNKNVLGDIKNNDLLGNITNYLIKKEKFQKYT